MRVALPSHIKRNPDPALWGRRKKELIQKLHKSRDVRERDGDALLTHDANDRKYFRMEWTRKLSL